MENGWIILPKDNDGNKDVDSYTKLLDFMNEIEDGRGWRFTEEQADTLAKLVDILIEQIRAYNKNRNKNRKRHGIIFLK